MINTLLPTPSAPRINTASGKATTTTGVWDTRVRLRWDAAAGGGGAAAGSGGAGNLTAGGGGGAGRAGTATDRAATKILMQVHRSVSRTVAEGREGIWGPAKVHFGLGMLVLTYRT